LAVTVQGLAFASLRQELSTAHTSAIERGLGSDLACSFLISLINARTEEEPVVLYIKVAVSTALQLETAIKIKQEQKHVMKEMETRMVRKCFQSRHFQS
jgi:hypothetical protein